MTTETDLLPLPEPTGNQIVMRGDDFQGDYNYYVSAFTGGQLEAYARANVAHATAPLQAEIEALRAEVATWEGLHASEVQVRQRWQARAERLAEALETCLEVEERPSIIEMARVALREHDQEGK